MEPWKQNRSHLDDLDSISYNNHKYAARDKKAAEI